MTTKKKASKKKALALSWKQQLAKHAKEGKAPKEAPAVGDFISTKGGKFSLGDRSMGREFRCVILGWCFERTFFDSKYVEKESNSPACFAISNVLEGMAPHKVSPNMQNDYCDECALSKWGDDTDPDKKPDCSERRRLIVSVEGADDRIEIKQLTIPPTSLKNWKGFVSKIATMGLHTMQCGVNIHFDEESTAAYPPICFDFVKEITKEKSLQAMAGMLDETAKLLEKPYDVSNYKAPKKGKKKVGKKKVVKKNRSKFS